MTKDKELYESGRVWDQDMQLGQANLLRALLDFLPQDTSSVLDVGCGDGKITRALIAATGLRIVGLDSSAEALSRCEFPTIQGDAASLGFPDAAFDAVLTTDMLEHLPPDVERRAWTELFRVAAKTVIVAVPFREELLDGTALCPGCGAHYHVNWHMRTYDWPQLLRMAPPGWMAGAIILTGEPWSAHHPIETRFRREVLDEWSGWADAICPNCGAPGERPAATLPLSGNLAAALAGQIYTDVLARGTSRTHSEIMVIYRRNEPSMVSQPAAPFAEPRAATVAQVTSSPQEENLLPYPSVARAVRGVDGGVVIQFPAFARCDALRLHWRADATRPANITVEDGLGLLFSGSLPPEPGASSLVRFPRPVAAGYYGLLVRHAPHADVERIETTGGSRDGLCLAPLTDADVGYHLLRIGDCPAYAQVTKPLWLDAEAIARVATPVTRSGWRELLTELARIEAIERDAHGDQVTALQATIDSLRAAQDELQAERDALRDAVNALETRPEVRVAAAMRRGLSSIRGGRR